MDVEKAIESAYSSHVVSLYKALSQAILMAKGNTSEIESAEERFSRGLAHAEEIRDRARRLAGL